MNIGFYGLSHLGLVYLVAYASKGLKVIGYDANSEVINELLSGSWSIKEPGLFQAYLDNRDRIRFTSNLHEFLNVDVIYFSQDVPTDSNGVSDLSGIEKAINTVITLVPKNITLILLSQVPPGFTRKYSEIYQNFFYQVETIVFGNALEISTSPERIIVGSAKGDYGIEELNLLFQVFACPVVWMSLESAELTKIAINMYLASSVTLTNALSDYSKTIGGNWSDIVHALQLDKRIGRDSYLRPGLGFSGGNIERDIETLRKLSTPDSLINRLTLAYQDASNIRRIWLREQVIEILKIPSFRISLLGLTYKPETNSTKNSIPLEILSEFRAHIQHVYDPALLNSSLYSTTDSIWAAIKDSEVLLIGTPWKEFFGIEELIIKSQVQIVIDPYDVLEPNKLATVNKYVSLTREFQK